MGTQQQALNLGASGLGLPGATRNAPLLLHIGGCGSSGKVLVAFTRREGHSLARRPCPAAPALSLTPQPGRLRQNAARDSAW